MFCSLDEYGNQNRHLRGRGSQHVQLAICSARKIYRSPISPKMEDEVHRLCSCVLILPDTLPSKRLGLLVNGLLLEMELSHCFGSSVSIWLLHKYDGYNV